MNEKPTRLYVSISVRISSSVYAYSGVHGETSVNLDVPSAAAYAIATTPALMQELVGEALAEYQTNAGEATKKEETS